MKTTIGEYFWGAGIIALIIVGCWLAFMARKHVYTGGIERRLDRIEQQINRIEARQSTNAAQR